MKKYLRHLSLFLFAVFGAIVFLNLFAGVSLRMEALHARFSVHTDRSGYTVLKVPPVGEVRAETHRGPLSFRIALENVDLDHLKQILAEGPEQGQMISEAKAALVKSLKRLIIVTLGLGFAGGVFGLLLIRVRNLKELLLGGLIGFTMVSVLLFAAYRSYDVGKFQHPEYDGMIKAAPWMINLVGESFSTVNTWSRQMRGIANNLYSLFERVDSLQAITPGDGEIKVLHISDIHNNPAAFNFVDQVVKTFNVDFIIDSGDLSDFGTPLEAAAFEKVADLKVPYLITPGNHETPDIVSALKKIPNVRVLEGEVRAVEGLAIAGTADPASYSNHWKTAEESMLAQYAQKLKEVIVKSGHQPDIAVAHNPLLAERLLGQAPVVLTGHDHRYRIKTGQSNVFINAGTSGAAGVGALKSAGEIPYTFVLLHFDRTPEGARLKYTDTISISNQQSGYSLERKVYPELYPDS